MLITIRSIQKQQQIQNSNPVQQQQLIPKSEQFIPQIQPQPLQSVKPISHLTPSQATPQNISQPTPQPQPQSNKFQILAQSIEACNSSSQFNKNNVRCLIDSVQAALHGPPVK